MEPMHSCYDSCFKVSTQIFADRKKSVQEVCVTDGFKDIRAYGDDITFHDPSEDTFQELWKRKYDWDDELAEDIDIQWSNWCSK